MESLHGILVFLRVVDTGTVSGAARGLGVSAAAVSAALARLERRLAVRLLNRTTRRLSLTAEGAEFYERCKHITAALEEAELTVGRAGRVPSGTLHVGMPSALGRLWIVPHLPEFVLQHPAVSLEIVCTDFVPHTMEQGLDVAVQIGELKASRLTVRPLAVTRYVICASPQHLAQHGVPRTPEDLRTHACLTYRRPRNGRIREWLYRSGNATRTMTMQGVMTFNSGEALVAAAAAGLGITQVAEYYAQSHLQNGELVEVLSGYRTAGYRISAVFPQQQPLAPKLRVFVDFLVAIFNRPPWNRAGATRRSHAAEEAT
jgi:LysR family transcriptional regulator for bpeEF and oprC